MEPSLSVTDVSDSQGPHPILFDVGLGRTLSRLMTGE